MNPISINVKKKIQQGEKIQIISYPLFIPNKRIIYFFLYHVKTFKASYPIISNGIISKIVINKKNNEPIIIQTNAIVQKGSSGGAIIDKYFF